MARPSRNITIASTIALAVGALVLASGAVPIATAGSRSDHSRAVSAPVALAAEAEASVRQYWTQQRMERARPMVAPDPARRKPKVTVSSDVGRNPRLVAGEGYVDVTEGRVVRAAMEQASLTYPFPFTRRPMEKQLRSARPYITVGRVFFTLKGSDYACTGASVASKPRQVVFTAGHCLNDGAGAWAKNVVFVPGLYGRAQPYGTFPAKVLWVPAGWSSAGDYSFDLGAFSVGKNSRRRSLQKNVGALGFAYNVSRIQHWNVVGYPALAPFGGKRQQLCSAAHAVDDAATGLGPDTIGIGCDMTGGSSGSPFIKDLGRGSYVNGTVSYGYAEQPKAAYSPYFDDTANNLRCAAATGVVAPSNVNYSGSCTLP
jgi:V8-like Glu-specific endopeptidase